jgi:alpha-beta hydrolase superfamily lysophospholipase
MTGAWSERPVVLDDAPAPLHGTLALPDGDGPCDGVLILAGSGPVDRDGNLPGATNNSLKLLAQELASRGVASLRVDKRGVAASRGAGPSEEDLRFATYVDDAVSWLGMLGGETRIARRFILGHSEGALVATLAAPRAMPAGLILVAGAGSPAGVAIRRQLAAADLPPRLLDAAERTLAALERGATVAEPPPRLAALFRPSVQPYLISWLTLDPVAAVAKIAAPILVIQGTTDLQVTVEDSRRLAGAQPGIALALIDGMNHVLKAAPAEHAANLATYADPTLTLAPQLVPTIIDFIGR